MRDTSPSKAFEHFHPDVQRWIWKQGWPALRDVQEQAAAPVMGGDRDVLISAATAAGKTEAAFLPIYSLLASRSDPGVGTLYISPLKALINDQRRRLDSLSEITGIPVTSWHGDASMAGKQQLRKDPRGVLLITPESLESLLMNSSDWCASAFINLTHVIIDEFHAFLGTERGIQLQSLLRCCFAPKTDPLTPHICIEF
ncbi:MAG: DEAD/DEAH box helicase [Candidatus Sedimenticola sp. (ex Thyasira tokunagai)]